MKIILASLGHVLNKKKCTVFSVDFWPKNKEYIVSGGQDGIVQLWRVQETDSKEIGKFAKHTGAVLGVRFSPKGDLLASAADDGNVFIWSVDEKETLLCLSAKKKIADHRSDVSSLAWTSKYLITGGYDGGVLVYETDGFSLVKRLERHEKGCKGVAVSPEGLYITTYGDEGEVFLYNQDLVKLASTKKPFKGVQLESFFSRMSWSPDAKYVACGLAFLDRRDAVAVLSTSLVRDYTLIGHAAPCEVVRFNPQVWEKEGSKYYVLATGAQDRSVALWSSGRPKPLVLLKEVAEQPIMDLQWSADGLSLVGCAYDGSVFILQLSAEELGSPVPVEIDKGENLVFSKEFIPAKDVPVPFPAVSTTTTPPEPTTTPLSTPTVNSGPGNQVPLKKKIVPRVIEPLKLAENQKTVRGPRVILYVPEKTVSKEIPDKDYAVEMETQNKGVVYRISIDRVIRRLIVKRDGLEWFRSEGLKIKGVAADGSILAIASEGYSADKQSLETLWIYSLEKCMLVLPAIAFKRLVAIDVHEDKVLAVMPGFFKVIDLTANSCIEDILIEQSAIISIALDKKYFVLALYADGSTQFYDQRMRTWFILELNCPSIYSDTFTSTQAELDSTFEHLENRCLVGLSYEEWSNTEETLSRLLLLIGNTPDCPPGLLNRLDGIIEGFLFYTGIGGIDFIKNLLHKTAETSKSLQKFAHYKIKELELRR
ncbi:protein HIRA/HIR1 [Nematocida homosporus]|uniref:protein HIRA/HIR1 n=1 Tax=Nematocida homosporus TaxID=1912981 RepID=UPI00221EA87D|nr:protein HIRA/HIR1 [Nematocida homosporus]KAI5186520.1 protein HIRA/HIR1 [Nematocida homosporus]